LGEHWVSPFFLIFEFLWPITIAIDRLNPAGHQILSMVTVNRRVFYLTVDWAV
jgi:hypothetical protein